MELASLNIQRPFIVTDAFLDKSGLLQPIYDGLTNGGLTIAGKFVDVPPNSELKIVQACAEQAKASGADGIIAIGGGSVLDTAKATNILFSHGGDLVRDYSGAETLPGELKPLVAIPTTAGTGSEVTHVAIILDQSTHTKLSFVDRHLAPHLALLDPELTLGLPAKMTAATGMDALTHAVEACTSVQANPFSKALSYEAIGLIRRALLKAVLHGDDIALRSDLMIAATMAGVAFDHSMVGVVHGLSHSLGGLAGVHHGTANSLFLPWGMLYNLEVCDGAYADMAQAFGVDKAGISKRDQALAVIESIRRLKRSLRDSCGLAATLHEAGVTKDMIDPICEGAVQDGTSFYNPREVIFEELKPLVEQAFDHV